MIRSFLKNSFCWHASQGKQMKSGGFMLAPAWWACLHTPSAGPWICTEHVCQGQRQARHDSHHALHDKAAACVRWQQKLFGCNKASINHSVSAGPTPDGGVGFQRDGEPFRCFGLMKCAFFFFPFPALPLSSV